MSDIEIIEQIIQGNSNLYRTIVERYQNMVFRTCMGFLHHKDDADDLTQEVFIQAYQSISKFKGDSSFSTWLYRIAVNTSLNKIRKSSKNYFLQRIESLFGSENAKALYIPSPDTDNPENILINNQNREIIQLALNSLAENQRTAIVLSKYDELSQREIADIMNITEGAVEALIQRAKSNLREKLSSFSKKNKK